MFALLFLLVSLATARIYPYWGKPFEQNYSPITGREYRPIDGWGNNLKHPEWGTQYVPFVREQMPARYYSGPLNVSNPNGPKANPEDGLDPTLPNVRLISNRMMEAHGKHKPNTVLLNQLRVEWGHLLTIDSLNSAVSRVPSATVRFPIPSDDLYADENWGDSAGFTCTVNRFGNCGKSGANSYVAQPRLAAFPGTGAGTGVPKAEYGDVSQWFDLSALYGNPLSPQIIFGPNQMTPWLEVSSDGQLLNWGKFILDKNNEFDAGAFFLPAFMLPTRWKTSGDFRFNKTPGLRVVLETFQREHNRLVDEFMVQHPNWDNYTLFQEARRWNIAFFQSITFREYLAAATGTPLTPYEGYDDEVNPGIDHFFACVTLRYGHSAVPSHIPLLDNNLDSCPYGALDAVYIWAPIQWHTPDPINPYYNPYTGNKTTTVQKVLDQESIIRGLAHSEANAVDFGIVDDIRNFQSQSGGPRHGNDLISVDIFRGRDIGLPDYNSAREFLGIGRVSTFEEINPDPVVAGTLRAVYGSVDRIDPIVGMFAEPHDIVEHGPTAITSMHEQFARLRDGDRFYFELQGESWSFTPKEIETIHNTKLRDLIIRNWPGIDPNALPVNSFFLNERQLTAFSPKKKFPDPPELPSGLPWVHRELSPVYQLYWAIDRNNTPHEFTFHIQVQTNGWAGLGFGPDFFGSMKGADIVLCRETQYVVECRDSHAFDVGVPALDSENGGENNLRNVIVTRNDGILTAQFTRLADTGDSLDKVIEDNLRIIFAFNPNTNELLYHGPTRNPDTVVDFEIEYLGPPERLYISIGVQIFLYVICGIGALITVIYMLLVILKKEFFIFQTPEFCLLIGVGALMGYASVLLLLPDGQNNGTCWASMWLFGMSFWIVFMGFFIKVARVYYIIKRTEKTMEVTVLPFWKLFIPLIVFMLGEMVFNICWDTLVPPNLEREDNFEDNTYVMYCGGDRGFWAGSVAFRATFLGIASILAVLTKDMPQEFNWSKEVAMSIYTAAIVLACAIPLGFALDLNANTVILLRGITICVAMFCVTTIVHSDSLKRLILGKGPREQTKTSHSVHRTRQNTSNSTIS